LWVVVVVVVLWGGWWGVVVVFEVGDVRRFEGELLQWLHRHRSDVLTSIESTGQLSDDNVESLKSGLDEFKELFKQGDTGLHLNEAEAEAMAEGRETRETVTREVRHTDKKQ
jgi:F-type H+-transporting ATPase subunit alpha